MSEKSQVYEVQLHVIFIVNIKSLLIFHAPNWYRPFQYEFKVIYLATLSHVLYVCIKASSG